MVGAAAVSCVRHVAAGLGLGPDRELGGFGVGAWVGDGLVEKISCPGQKCLWVIHIVKIGMATLICCPSDQTM